MNGTAFHLWNRKMLEWVGFLGRKGLKKWKQKVDWSFWSYFPYRVKPEGTFLSCHLRLTGPLLTGCYESSPFFFVFVFKLVHFKFQFDYVAPSTCHSILICSGLVGPTAGASINGLKQLPLNNGQPSINQWPS